MDTCTNVHDSAWHDYDFLACRPKCRYPENREIAVIKIGLDLTPLTQSQMHDTSIYDRRWVTHRFRMRAFTTSVKVGRLTQSALATKRPDTVQSRAITLYSAIVALHAHHVLRNAPVFLSFAGVAHNRRRCCVLEAAGGEGHPENQSHH